MCGRRRENVGEDSILPKKALTGHERREDDIFPYGEVGDTREGRPYGSDDGSAEEILRAAEGVGPYTKHGRRGGNGGELSLAENGAEGVR